MANYSIKDLEHLSGIKAHTIRIWEKRYHLLEPSRTDTNIRYYSDEDLKKILNIALLNKRGLKISQLARLANEEIAEKVLITTKDITDFEVIIDQLVISMVELDEQKFDKIVTRIILQTSFEETIMKIIYPFLDRIGILWMTGSINPVQEHFVSNLIRQKLIVAIDEILNKPHTDPKKFLLFLPEGELHELGLLFLSYLIQKRGHEVIYFGQWVPLNDLAVTVTVEDFDYLLTSVISVYSCEDLMDYLNRLVATFPDKTIFASGNQILQLTQSLPDKVKKIDSLDHFLRFLESE